jgi:hypothetical protein
MQSVPITTNVVSSNPVHGEVYSIQHYVIKFVSDLRHVGVFFQGTKTENDLNGTSYNRLHAMNCFVHFFYCQKITTNIIAQIGIFLLINMRASRALSCRLLRI